MKNFRSLHNVHVDLHESTILLGENNAGKTFDETYVNSYLFQDTNFLKKPRA